jgi:hypothetical protein
VIETSTGLPPVEAARYRVVSRTQAVAVSPIAQADSRLRVGARTRRRGARKMKIEGSVLPAAAGTASLERRNRRGHWRAIKSKATWLETELRGRYRFTVRRKRRERDYRVVVAPDDGGAHVRGTSRTVAVKARRR